MKNNTLNWKILLVISIIVTFFLFYIDEGYYNFSWIKSFENWFVFIIYAGVIFVIQLLFSKLLFKKSKKYLIPILGITVLILVLYIFR